MKIFIDCDGVIVDFESNISRVVNALWPGRIEPGYRPPDWDYSDKLNKSDWAAVWSEVRLLPDFWLRAQPIYQNVKDLKTWLKESPGHELFFITSRIPTGDVYPDAQTKLWLHIYGILQDGMRVIAVSRPEEKRYQILKHRIDIGIDDYAPTVADLNTIPTHSCFLLSQPWNQDSDQPRVESLRQFLSMVPKLATANSQAELDCARIDS